MEETKQKVQPVKEGQAANMQRADGRWERFEFKLTINGNIICQRYFRINGYRNDSRFSLDLIDSLKRCAYIIDHDIRDKAHIFLSLTCPQLVKTYDEMVDYYKKYPLDENGMPQYVLVEDTEEVYVVNNGNPPVVFEKPFNKYEYLPPKEPVDPITFKFGFYEYGKEVASVSWDGSHYPRFVRTNVDLSNQKNKYRQEGVFSPIEAYVIDQCIKGKVDLIPIILRELCQTCTYKSDEGYETKYVVGNKAYNLDIEEENRRYFKKMENAYKRKTIKYLGNNGGTKKK